MPGRINQPPFSMGQPIYELVNVTCKPPAEYDSFTTSNDV
jgi:hypothetical protein